MRQRDCATSTEWHCVEGFARTLAAAEVHIAERHVAEQLLPPGDGEANADRLRSKPASLGGPQNWRREKSAGRG